MSFLYDPFGAVPDFELDERIRSRAGDCGIDLSDETVKALVSFSSSTPTT